MPPTIENPPSHPKSGRLAFEAIKRARSGRIVSIHPHAVNLLLEEKKVEGSEWGVKDTGDEGEAKEEAKGNLVALLPSPIPLHPWAVRIPESQWPRENLQNWRPDQPVRLEDGRLTILSMTISLETLEPVELTLRRRPSLPIESKIRDRRDLWDLKNPGEIMGNGKFNNHSDIPGASRSELFDETIARLLILLQDSYQDFFQGSFQGSGDGLISSSSFQDLCQGSFEGSRDGPISFAPRFNEGVRFPPSAQTVSTVSLPSREHPPESLPSTSPPSSSGSLFDETIARLLATFHDNKNPATLAKLIGVGEGLTPSGDDILVGVLASWDFLREIAPETTPARIRLEQSLPRPLDQWTPRLSAQMLQAALDGHYPEPLVDLLDAMFDALPSISPPTPITPPPPITPPLPITPSPYLPPDTLSSLPDVASSLPSEIQPNPLESAISRVLALGSRSGKDFLRGIRLGFQSLRPYRKM